MRKCIYVLMVSCLLITSCSLRNTSIKTIGKKPYIDYNKVELYVNTPENVKFDKLGEVEVNSFGKEDALESIKKAAAKLGGNAIFNMKTDDVTESGGRYYISGDVVLIKQKRK